MTTPPNGLPDALPSWNEGDAKQSIVDFVRRTTAEGSPEFVPLHERIALFDNDGTLWVEQPMYTQLAFVIADVKRLASAHPEWQTNEPFRSVLEDDMAGVAASGTIGIMKLLGATQTGMSTTEFAQAVSDWIESARHPRGLILISADHRHQFCVLALREARQDKSLRDRAQAHYRKPHRVPHTH